ncbi:MAG TPA: SpoIIE family protein phosphatase [Spirochaetota bacterium]|nr:SpoIIE family protein phosphatase [Spirochaetota bacterium]
MEPSDIILIKKKYRNNYIARLVWSLVLFAFVIFKVKGFLLVFFAAHIGLSIIWIALVELNAPIIYWENLRFLRIVMDAALYTISIYITGGANSFMMLSYVIFIIQASLYTTMQFGVFAAVSCVVFYNAMLLFIHLGQLPQINILYGADHVSVPINQWTVLLTNFVLLLVSTVMIITANSLYRKLMDKTEELKNERNLLKERNTIIENDMKIARRIQEQLIPQTSPFPFIHTLYKPMEEVGGDFFDFLEFRDPSKIGIFLSDVTGHGVPAAFITSMVKTMILQSGQTRNDPANLLMYLNGLLYGKTAEHFITAFYGIYNMENRSLLYSSAGHNPPYHLKSKGISLIDDAKSIPLAIADNEFLLNTGKAYSNQTRVSEKGDRFIFYTDGLVEEKGGDGIHESFEDLLLENVLPHQRDFSSRRIIENLRKTLVSWSGTTRFADDVCIVCVEVE